MNSNTLLSHKNESIPPEIKFESLIFYLKNLISIALPSTFSSLLWVFQNVISLYFVGKLHNVIYLDAFSLALSWYYIFGGSFLSGLASAMDTLISQSFGAGEYKKCSIHLARGLIILFIASIPCCFFMYLSGPLLIIFGVNPEIAENTHNATISLIPFIFIYIPQLLLEKFMLGQRIAQPQMIIQIINICLQPCFCWLFIFHFDFKYQGAMYARASFSLIYFIGMAFYLYFSGRCEKTLHIPTKDDIFSGWKNYFEIALPSMLMICLEYFACVGLALLCAKYGIIDLAAHSISCNYGDLLFCTGLGMGCSICTLVGNSIGEQNIKNAQKYAFYGISFTFVVLTVIQIPVLIFRIPLIRLFTEDKQVIEKLSSLLFLVVFREIFDGGQTALGRTLIGMGKQNFACKVNLIVYYCIMLPLGLLFGNFIGLGVFGIWVSTSIAAILVSLSFIREIYKQDWLILLEESQKRLIKN